MDQLHASKSEVGLYLGLLMAGMAVGNALARKLIQHLPVERLMLSGNLLSLVCVALLLLRRSPTISACQFWWAL